MALVAAFSNGYVKIRPSEMAATYTNRFLVISLDMDSGVPDGFASLETFGVRPLHVLRQPRRMSIHLLRYPHSKIYITLPCGRHRC